MPMRQAGIELTGDKATICGPSDDMSKVAGMHEMIAEYTEGVFVIVPNFEFVEFIINL